AEFAIINDSGETDLAPSTTRTFDVEFAPSAAGSRVAGIRVVSDDADQTPLDISLEGVGLNPQVGVVPMTTLNLGTVAVDAGSSVPVAAVITNTGESNLTISSVSIAGTNAAEFTIAADTADTVLTPNMSRTVNIAFDPAATGQRTANLQIATDDFDNPTVSIALTGEGVTSNVVIPNIQVTPNTVDYPDAKDINNKTAILKTVAITNTGNGDLAITNIELTGPNRDAFVITTDSGESVLAPMESRTIVLNFSPDVTGNLSATLAITSNDPDSPTIEVPITGEAVQQDGGTGGDNNGGGDSGGGAMHIELLALLSFLLLSRARIRRREKQF
ncbi:choice-of-anchor D domain-containing protein, partial [Kaarinaea lacus]